MNENLEKDLQKLPLVIVGTGPLARIALDIAGTIDVLVYGFLTEEETEVRKELNDHGVIAKLDSVDARLLLKEEKLQLIVAADEISSRQLLTEELKKAGRECSNLVSPMALISPYAAMEKGNILAPGVILNPNSSLGSHSVLHPDVSLAPDAKVGNFCTLHSGVRIGTKAVIEDEVYLGLGVIVHPGITIGKGANVVAGSVVLKNVPPGATVFGNPAQEA